MLWKWRGRGASPGCLTEAETRIQRRQEQGETRSVPEPDLRGDLRGAGHLWLMIAPLCCGLE